jgi:hypothetical protein
VQAGSPEGAAVAAEELDRAGLSGDHRGQAMPCQLGGDQQEHGGHDQGGRACSGAPPDAEDQQRDPGEQGRDTEDQDADAGR